MTKTTNDSEVLAEGQQVIVACALIHNNFDGVEKIFLPKRAETKKFMPNVYELPGGHIDFGEDIVAGLQRELREEFGKDIVVGDPFAAFTYKNDIKCSHSIEVVYFARFVDGIEGIKLNPEDHSGYDWISEDQLDLVAANKERGKDDEEYVILDKAFKLLKGNSLVF